MTDTKTLKEEKGTTKSRKKSPTLTPNGTSISINADAVEVLRTAKSQREEWQYISLTKFCQILLAEKLNDMQGKTKLVDYRKIFGLVE